MGLVNRLYVDYSIYDSQRRKSIPLTFQPEEETNTVNSKFEYQNLMGRVGSVASYGGTDSETITFSFDAIQGYLPPGYSDIDTYCTDLKNLTRKTLSNKSPECRLNLGRNSYDGYVDSVVVAKSGPFDTKSRRLKATITISFTCKNATSGEVG